MKLDADWQAVSGSCNGDGKAGETGEIEPLRVAHGFAITRAGTPIAFAMAESGRGANWGQKNGDVFHCFEDAGRARNREPRIFVMNSSIVVGAFRARASK